MLGCNSVKSAGVVVTLLLTEVAAAFAPCSSTISRDVVVIGGGAAGAHAAVWLRDHGRSVVVVEKANHLGGHTDFYTDRDTGKTINVGVQAWMEYKNTLDFPARMNVSTDGAMQFAPLEYKYVYFKTGLPVPGFAAPAEANVQAALQRYLAVLEKYEDLVLPGFNRFPSPEAIPEDLLMPFGDFVEKHDLADAVPRIWDSTAQGLGDPLNLPTLWVVQASGVPMVRALQGTARASVPASGRLFDLFESISAFLGGDVLYSSTVASTKRRADGVELEVHSTLDGGKVTCIAAKRLLVAIEPTPENVQTLDLDAAEKEILAKFKFATVYAGILRHPSLQPGTAYSHRLPEAGPGNHSVFPVAPQVGRIDHLGGTRDLFQFTAVGRQDDTADSIKRLINQSIDNLIAAGTIPVTDSMANNGTLAVSFDVFADHGKMHAHVSAEELRAGFIQNLLSLQGRRSTWYAGAAFSSAFTTVLWDYNESLLPSVTRGI